jgi:Tfp pilus assembly protein PilF
MKMPVSLKRCRRDARHGAGGLRAQERLQEGLARQRRQANMQLAIEYMKLGKIGVSRDFIERALSGDPDNPSVQMTAGMIYERLGDMPKAERAYSTAAHSGKATRTSRTAMRDSCAAPARAAAGEKLFNEVARNPLYQTPEVALVNAGVCVRQQGRLVDAPSATSTARWRSGRTCPRPCCSSEHRSSTAATPRRRARPCSAIWR